MENQADDDARGNLTTNVTVLGNGALPTDGRAARSHRTVEHIVKSLLDLVERDGHMRPTAHQLARRANVSRRGIYLHFDSVEDIFVEAMGRRLAEIQAAWKDPAPDLSLRGRIQWFCHRWPDVIERLSPIRRAATTHETSSLPVAGALDRVRCWARGTVERVFQPELNLAADQHDDPSLATALHYVTSLSAWGDLYHQGARPAEASGAMRRLLGALLVPSPADQLTRLDLTEPRNGHDHRARGTGGNGGAGVESMLHAGVLLALLPAGRSLPAAKLGEYQGLPPGSLARHLQSLTRAGLVEIGRERVKGGYQLARSPEDITLLDIIDAVDDTDPIAQSVPIRLQRAQGGEADGRSAKCYLTAAVHQAEQAWRDVLAGMTLADAVDATVDQALSEVAAGPLVWLKGIDR